MDLSGHQHSTTRRGPRTRLGIAAAAGLLVLSGCGDGGEQPGPAPSADGPVVVGAGTSPQTQTIADIWAMALEDGGVPAEVREVEGGRAGYLQAVEDGSIDVFPDYTGDLYLELDAASAGEEPAPSASPSTGASPSADAGADADADAGAEDAEAEQEDLGLVDSLSSLLGQDPDSDGFSDADVESALTEVLPEGTELLSTASADRTRALAVTAATRAGMSGGSLESLAEDCADLAVGVPQEELDDPVTVPALEALYDCAPGEVVGYDSQEELVDALLRDEVQASVLVTTRPEIDDHALAVLEDNRGALLPERAVPVAGQRLPDEARGVLDDVNDRLDAEALTLLTRMTTSSTPYSPYEAADYWWGQQ